MLLLAAAALGLVLANTSLGPAVLGFKELHLAVPGTPLDLSIGHWVADGLLAVFFFIVAIELKHELVAGELNSPAKALRPAIAALGDCSFEECMIDAEFLQNVGFTVVAPHPYFPRLRLELDKGLGWKAEVEAALERLLESAVLQQPVGSR